MRLTPFADRAEVAQRCAFPISSIVLATSFVEAGGYAHDSLVSGAIVSKRGVVTTPSQKWRGSRTQTV